jgi:curli biogenesis system outer membrane secretion channel CsgG
VLAVVDFEDLVHGRESATEVVTTHLINRLREEPSVRVLPRHTVQRALTDAKVEGRGLLDPADAQKVGEALGADYIVMGEVTEFNWDYQSAYLLVTTLTKRIANVILKGSVLDVALAHFVTTGGQEPSHGDRRLLLGPWPVGFSADNFDNALIGEAIKKSVDQFVEQVMASVK